MRKRDKKANFDQVYMPKKRTTRGIMGSGEDEKERDIEIRLERSS